MKTLRIAVIGGGHLGRIHGRLLAEMEGVHVVAVADPVPAAREQAAAIAKTEAVADFRDLIGRIDAAVVATPTRFHRDVTLELAAAGVHVFVEKPIASTSAEANEMVAAARKNGVVLQVGHVERFNPVWNRKTEFIPFQEPPRYIEAERCGPYTFRSTDVSVVFDLMVHDVDIALSLVNSPVVRVDAVGSSVVGPHDDLASAWLTFANGAVASLKASRVSYEARRRMRIFSATGYVSLDFGGRTATLVQAPDDSATFTPHAPTSSPPPYILPIEHTPAQDGNAIAAELADFANSIRTGQSPRVTGEQGAAAVDICEQIVAKIAEWIGPGKARTLRHPAADGPRRVAG